MARPEWSPSKAELKAIYEMAKAGYTDGRIAKVLNIANDTYIKHKSKFFEELKKGREEGTPIIVDMVVSALVKKCLGFEYEEVTEEAHYIHKDGYMAIEEGKQMRVTKRVKKFVPPSDQAIFYYLGNRAADKWRSVNYKSEIDIGDNAKEYFKEIVKAMRERDLDGKSEKITTKAK
jgi:hypothetical protein